MRRGRPTNAAPAPAAAAAAAAANVKQKPSPSPIRVGVPNGDPFAALDSGRGTKGPADELSSRFPTLDQFSILHEQGNIFDFDDLTSPRSNPREGPKTPQQLADEAFSGALSPPQPAEAPRPKSVVPAGPAMKPPPVESGLHKTASAPSKPDMSRAQAIINRNPALRAISSGSPASGYVSAGDEPAAEKPVSMAREQPAEYRSSSSPRVERFGQEKEDTGMSATMTRVPSFTLNPMPMDNVSSPSRPLFEGGRPSRDKFDQPLRRTSSLTVRPRPASTHLEGSMSMAPDWAKSNQTKSAMQSPSIRPADDPSTDEYLGMEEDDGRKEKPGKNYKISTFAPLAGAKNRLSGKFGDAFKRFEGSHSPTTQDAPKRTPSPLKSTERRHLTPIAGSEAAADDRSEMLDDPEDISPEMRREMERRRLSDEEGRVAAAQAEHRKRLAERDASTASGTTPALPRSIGGVSRAVSIQNRVQSLLDEGSKPPSVTRSAEGYGKFSDAATAASRLDKKLPDLPRKLVRKPSDGPKPASAPPAAQPTFSHGAAAQGPDSARPTRPPKPPAPKKPYHLNHIPTGGRGGSPPKSKTLPVLPTGDDDVRKFNQRFPSLGKLDLVERDIPPGSGER